MKILIVDDESAITELFRIVLSHERHRVQTAKDGYEASRLAIEFVPDVILTDNDMPGMTGIELAIVLKRLPSQPKVILMTGRPDSEVIRDATRVGIDSLIPKPVPSRQLLAEIARITSNTYAEQKHVLLTT